LISRDLHDDVIAKSWHSCIVNKHVRRVGFSKCMAQLKVLLRNPTDQCEEKFMREASRQRDSLFWRHCTVRITVWKSFTCGRRVGKHLLCRLVKKGLYGVGKHAHWLQISRIWQLMFMPLAKLVPWIMDHAAPCKIHP